MSTDWDIHCRTCHSDLGLVDANHLGELVEQIRLNIAALVPLGRLDLGIWPLELMIGHRSIDLAWVAQHASHDLVTQSEYGQIYGDCNEWPPDGGICRLKPGHEGEHADKPAAG